jgi:alkanesulfonate monooxygenase SsuD/methylene tetrahydromethanopterin reductase-like flavin-dependent oxidoreductase (luciferase family)
MEIGIGAPTGIPGTSRERILEWARRAERRGFSTIAAVDRLNDSLDPLTSLAAMSVVTERIRLMTAVLIVPRRGSPAELAQQVATLHRLSRGRLVLGVGLGNPYDYHASEAAVPGQRRRLKTTITEMRRIWSGAPEPDGVAIGPTIAGRGPDIITGGHSEAALRRAAEYEGWLGGMVTPDGFAQSAEQVRQAWRDTGRPGAPRLTYFLYYGLGDDAASRTDRYLRTFYQGLPEAFVDYSVERAVVGEEDIRKAVSGYAGAGCDELLLIPTTTSDPAQVDLLADVIALGG